MVKGNINDESQMYGMSTNAAAHTLNSNVSCKMPFNTQCNVSKIQGGLKSLYIYIYIYYISFFWNHVSHTLWSLWRVSIDTNYSSAVSSYSLYQSLIWSWAPPGARPHPECCRNARPLCYTSSLQAQRLSACPCQCSRDAC